MKNILMKAMMISISEVMETMFFLPVELGAELSFAQFGVNTENAIICRLTFDGDSSGCLILAAPIDLLAEMAENFMGESREHLSEQYLSGTLTEMVNMVCGNGLSKINSKIPFELGIPEVINESEISNAEICTIVETTNSKMAVLLKVD